MDIKAYIEEQEQVFQNAYLKHKTKNPDSVMSFEEFKVKAQKKIDELEAAERKRSRDEFDAILKAKSKESLQNFLIYTCIFIGYICWFAYSDTFILFRLFESMIGMVIGGVASLPIIYLFQKK
jgi:hypothetical protein